MSFLLSLKCQSFNGKKWEKFNSEKVASLAYARIQGKTALVAHFQNSSLMNEDKRCRPILLNSECSENNDQVRIRILNTTSYIYSNSIFILRRAADSYSLLFPYLLLVLSSYFLFFPLFWNVVSRWFRFYQELIYLEIGTKPLVVGDVAEIIDIQDEGTSNSTFSSNSPDK